MSLKEYATIGEGRKIGRGPPSFANGFELYLKGNGDLLLDFQQGVSRSDLFLKTLSVIRIKDRWGGGGQARSLGQEVS